MKKIINSSKAPSPVGPYNHSVRTGNILFVSGQIAIDPTSGQIVNNSIEDETTQVMSNLGAILNEAGLTFDSIVKCSIFVKNMQHYSRINKIYAQYFNDETAPARELVEVSALPKYVNIEVSAIATFE